MKITIRREDFGKIVRAVAVCRDDGDASREPWSAASAWQRETDCQIADAVILHFVQTLAVAVRDDDDDYEVVYA